MVHAWRTVVVRVLPGKQSYYEEYEMRALLRELDLMQKMWQGWGRADLEKELENPRIDCKSDCSSGVDDIRT